MDFQLSCSQRWRPWLWFWPKFTRTIYWISTLVRARYLFAQRHGSVQAKSVFYCEAECNSSLFCSLCSSCSAYVVEVSGSPRKQHWYYQTVFQGSPEGGSTSKAQLYSSCFCDIKNVSWKSCYSSDSASANLPTGSYVIASGKLMSRCSKSYVFCSHHFQWSCIYTDQIRISYSVLCFSNSCSLVPDNPRTSWIYIETMPFFICLHLCYSGNDHEIPTISSKAESFQQFWITFWAGTFNKGRTTGYTSCQTNFSKEDCS